MSLFRLRDLHPRKLIAATLLSLLASATSHADSHTEPPQVLVSIKPLVLIASAITEGISKPELLLPPGSSPHDYNLRPSDVRKLASANLVFWIGPDMESFLVKVLKRHVGEQKTTALMDSRGIKVSNFLSAEHEQEDHAQNHNHNHEHGSHDPHIWLDPENVIAMAQVMTQKLIAVDSSNRQRYENNYQKFVAQIRTVDQRNKTLLKSVSDQGFFVFHDAWGYLARHYNLKVVDVFTINPAQAPGARHMASLRKQLKAQNHQSCVFREPQFQPSYLNTLVDDLQIKVSTLDPLAADIDTSPNGYSQYLNDIATTIYQCLSTTTKPIATVATNP